MTRSNSALARNSLLSRQLKRVNNKSRFSIVRGEFEDAETLFLDEGKLSWGVDHEDANEQHLQEVLTASQRYQPDSNATGNRGQAEAKSAVYIPTPDSTGVIADYAKFYQAQRWNDPSGYVRSSETVEETLTGALANGFAYYMDERDQEWLEKNNEQARGEGTSAFGALSTAGSSARPDSSTRASKAKGKEPDIPQSVTMTEDEFELVMAIFEKVTHEKTEFLHHSFDPKSFPVFSEYQPTFSSPLPPTMFPSLVVPAWIPSPPQLLRIARVVYPYWQERRVERNGYQIIPALNLDESDTLNESYICFRRRDVKIARKTRQTQQMSAERLVRLSAELSVVFDVAQSVLAREKCKKELNQHAQEVWDQRLVLVGTKRKLFPGVKGDEELLFDKETTSKKPRLDTKMTSAKRSNANGAAGTHGEALVRPRDRLLILQSKTEKEIQKQKQKDYNWDDQTENAYQPRPQPFSSRLFRYISPNASSSLSSSVDTKEEAPSRSSRALRIRVGRGGCLRLDRRSTPRWPTSNWESAGSDDQDEEERRRLLEKWRYDVDDEPAFGPDGPDDEDRLMVDEYESRITLPKMLLLQETDHQRMITNSAIPITTSDGRTQYMLPYRLGAPRPIGQPIAQQPHTQAQPVSRPVQAQQPVALRPNGHGSPPNPTATLAALAESKSLIAANAAQQLQQAQAQAATTNGGMGPPSLALPQVAIAQAAQQNGQNHSVPNGTGNRPTMNVAQQSQALTAQYLQAHQAQLQAQAQAAQAQAQNQLKQQALHALTGQNNVDGNNVPNRQGNASPQKALAHASLPYHKYQAATGVNGYTGAAQHNPAVTAAALAISQQQIPQLTPQQLQQLQATFAHLTPQDLVALTTNGNRLLQNFAAAHAQQAQAQAQAQVQAQQAQAQQAAQAHHAHQQNGGTGTGVSFNTQIPTAANMMLKLPPTRQHLQWPSGAGGVTTNGVHINGASVNGVNGAALDHASATQRSSHSPSYAQNGVNGMH